ncbi:MAG: GTP-binding protein [Verrucomicrobiaceae bacterium]|nr:GTP-binding protein [Verrucomicrobiaceae bacterium]
MIFPFTRSKKDDVADEQSGMNDALERIQHAVRTKSTHLNLSGMKLASVPEVLGQCRDLKELDLSNNRFTNVPEAIGRLTALQKLRLSCNYLTTVPELLRQLTELQWLDLVGNQLTSVSPALGQLKAMRRLDISGNYLTGVPEALGQLTALELLDLSHNYLMSVPDTLGQLCALQVLCLHNNRLATLPESMRALPNLAALYLHENPGLGLPEDTLGPQWYLVAKGSTEPKQPKEILNYYFSTCALTKRPLNEAKLILLGRGGAGKTSLRKRLLTDAWDEHEDKTPGIAVTTWPLRLGSEAVQLNVWDFGGQEIMHATHQFFLTKRSLYLLVLNAREGEQDANVEYWLRLINGYGAGSPALVVINKCDQHPLDLDERGLQEKFPFIRSFVKTDCKTKTGLRELRAAIEREAGSLPELRTPFPAEWFGLKRKLAELPGDCITLDSYRALCVREKEPDETSQDVLISYLHDLGTVLHFRDDHRLNHLGVLKPDWVTQGIYGLLNADLLKAAGGELHAAQLAPLLDSKRYPHERHGFLLQLMEKFELCFDLPGTQRTRFLIPELLPKETPELAEWRDAEALRFEYHYNILPEGLLPRFIVRTHALSEGLKRWRSGVVLKQGDALALVRADVQERVATIAVRGPGRQQRDLLAVVRGHFEEIHRGISGLTAEEKVPVPVYPKVKLDYRKLLVREANGKETVEFETDTDTIELPLGRLLDNFEELASRRDRMRVGYSLEELTQLKALMKGDTINQTFNGGTFTGPVAAVMKNCTSIINQQTNAERKTLLEDIERAAGQIITLLPPEKQEKQAKNLKQLVETTVDAEPDREWYSLSAKGLLEASEFVKKFSGNLVDTLSKPIEKLGKLLWSDFLLPPVKKD